MLIDVAIVLNRGLISFMKVIDKLVFIVLQTQQKKQLMKM